jgi:hypothetical protein
VDKITNSLQVAVPQGSFVDEGDGVISFPNGLVITDGTVQRNGTRYDIDTLDISRYGNQLTGDHKDELGNLIGETIGVVKQNGKVIVNKIRYAIKENPYGRLAYDLLRGGFSKNFSTETIGPQPDASSGIYWNAELVGLSQVVTQNNYNAHVNKFNEVVHNSLEQSKQDGLDVTGIEERVLNSTAEEEKKMEENKDKKVEEVITDEEAAKTTTVVDETEKVEVEEAEEVETETESEKEEVEVEAPAEDVETKIETEEAETAKNDATEEEAEVEVEETETKVENEVEEKEAEVVTEEKETNNKETKMTKEDIAEIVANALKPIATELATVREEAKNAFDASAKEPEFKKEEEVAKNDYKSMDFEDRYQAQVDAAWNYLQNGNIAAGETLRSINQVNLDALKDAKIARNSISLEELGNFVIAPEMYNEIAGHRNDYTAILNATDWKETLSLEFAWLERVGDIDMKSVALNATAEDADANLKPISEYSAVPRKSQLEELAAVTVVATSLTRFAAVDLLADAAQGYRNDFDRKRAQLVIAKLEGAIDKTGFSTGYAPTENVDALTAWIDAVTDISDTTLNGTLIFNARTFAELKSRALRAGANGPLSEILTTGELPTVFGYKFIIVPNDLMPSLGGSESIAHIIEGVSVPINHAVFFADLTTFTGRTSGGLQYDVSNSAPYEVGGVTRSAYQRNELVLRGSFFRGGAVKDVQVVSGIRQGAAANVS